MLKLLRPKHWIKNAFVFAPLIFSGLASNLDAILASCVAAAFFCLVSSTVYVLNDIIDLPNDKKHPKKALSRPIASGQVSLARAKLLCACLILLSSLTFLYSTSLSLILLTYLVLNIAYSLKLKKLPIIDIFCIAFGFVLRVYAGAVVLDVPVSIWMFIATLCLSLFLASIKRRQELLLTGTSSRDSLKYYNSDVLTRYAEISSIGALVFYSMYIALIQPNLGFSIPFVIFGLFRYWYIIELKQGGESPTDSLWSDPTLIITILLWIASCVYGLTVAI